MKLPPFEFVKNQASWSKCLAALKREPKLAIDLEANSLYAYRERVCLIQISIPEQDYIIDPVAGFDLQALGDIIANPAVEKIFHAAEYDLILLKRQYGWRLNNLFDTMWATRILGKDRCGLANLLASYFEVKQNKKYQKANWCKRPLSPAQLAYAQADTHFLIALADQLEEELQAAGRMEEAREIFAEQTLVQLPDNGFDPDGFWSIGAVKNMTGRQRAIVKALYLYRDEQAQKQNRPPFKIFGDRTLTELAEAAPVTLDALPPIYGMSSGQIRRYGRQLIRIIDEARQAPAPKRPRSNNKRPPDAVYNRYEKLYSWRKQRARRRGVESDVIISRDALWQLAHHNPKSHRDLAQIPCLGDWRRQAYGEDIIKALNG
ncbi:MAG: HRDC domain-containing protein [Chloroflexota bacterium]